MQIVLFIVMMVVIAGIVGTNIIRAIKELEDRILEKLDQHEEQRMEKLDQIADLLRKQTSF